MTRSRVSHRYVIVEVLSRTNIFCDEAAIVFQAASQRCFGSRYCVFEGLTECDTAKLIVSKAFDDGQRVAMESAQVTEVAGCRSQVFQIDVGEKGVCMRMSTRSDGSCRCR